MNLGMPEMLFIFLMALVIFGPKKLPELARQLGKIMAEFKRATNDFKYQIENEIEQMELQERVEQREKSRAQQLTDGELTILPPPPPGAISNSTITGSGMVVDAEASSDPVEDNSSSRATSHEESAAPHDGDHEPEQMSLPSEAPAIDTSQREPNVI